MEISIELILACLMLIPIIIINIIIKFGSFFQKYVSKIFQRISKTEDKFNNQLNKAFNLINIAIKIIVGILCVLTLDHIFSLESIFVFVAFHFGVNLSRRIIFTINDLKIMKQDSSNKKIIKSFTLVVKLVIVVELLFLISWGILFKYLSFSIKSNLGIDVNSLMIILWISGFFYGLIFSLVQSIFIKNLLLKNEIGIALFISRQTINDNLKRKNIFQKFSKV